MFKKKEKKHFYNITPDMSEYGTIVQLFQNDFSKNNYEYVNINYGINAIEKGAFKDMVSLKEIIINDSVRVIEAQSFKGCVKLSSIKLPKNLSEISSEVFYDCNALENIILPQTIRKIGSNAFTNCFELKTIVLPLSLRIIGSEAFTGCTSLKELIIPKDVISIGTNIIKDSQIETVIIHNRFKDNIDSIIPGYTRIEEVDKELLRVYTEKRHFD